MKFISFVKNTSGGLRFGALIDDGAAVLDLSAVSSGIERPAAFLDWFDQDTPCHQEARSLVNRTETDLGARAEMEDGGCLLPPDDALLLAPVPRPGKLICIGLNYRDHAEESGMAIPESPVVFSKFPTSVIGPHGPVSLPLGSQEVDYEAELAVVIGRRCSRVDAADAYDHVLGYTNLNDVSARDFQFADGQWQRGKSCDTFAPMGPFIATTEEIPDPHALSIKLHLNGRTMQDSCTDQLIFGVPQLIAFLSRSITLEPGDVIATGTPPGVGFARKPPVYIADGDRMEVEIAGLGILENPVTSADPSP